MALKNNKEFLKCLNMYQIVSVCECMCICSFVCECQILGMIHHPTPLSQITKNGDEVLMI